MAIANFDSPARSTPARSSRVMLGNKRSNWSIRVTRFLSCHFQSFHSASGIEAQLPFPADRNVFKVSNCS